MGISTELWRMRIGVFTQPRARASRTKHASDRYTAYTARPWTPALEMRYRLFVTAIVLCSVLVVGVTFSQFCDYAKLNILESASCAGCRGKMAADGQLTNVVSQRMLAGMLLMLSGDVETNPGPTVDEVFKLQQDMLSEIRGMKSDLGKQMSELKIENEKTNTALLVMKTELDSFRAEQDILRLDIDALAVRIEYGDLQEGAGLDNRVSTLENVLEKQEQFQRRNNIIMHGVPKHYEKPLGISKKRWRTHSTCRKRRTPTPPCGQTTSILHIDLVKLDRKNPALYW